MQTATKQLWAGVLAAIVGSLCCVAPLVLLTLGISGAWISQLTALERVPGVSSTTVDFDKKTATVTFDPEKATAAKLTQATTEAGFPSKVIAKP
jgi:periplasmic mercuric ion binding protein